jgi:hypothetical protein
MDPIRNHFNSLSNGEYAGGLALGTLIGLVIAGVVSAGLRWLTDIEPNSTQEIILRVTFAIMFIVLCAGEMLTYLNRRADHRQGPPGPLSASGGR